MPGGAVDDQRSPVRQIVVVVQHGKLCLPQGERRAEPAGEQALVKTLDQVRGSIVVHAPECGNDLPGTCIKEGLGEGGQLFAGNILALGGAAAQDDELRNVETRNFAQPEHTLGFSRTRPSGRKGDAGKLRMARDQDRMGRDVQNIERWARLGSDVFESRLLAAQLVK